METLDPVINYGPNDAGASALTIFLVVVGILAGSWFLGAAYGFITSWFNGTKK